MANKMIKLKSSDGKIFEIEESVAIQSNTIKQMTEVNCSDNVIPLQIANNILIKIIEYCKRHSAEDENSESAEFNLKQKQKSSEAESSESPESNLKINQKQKSSESNLKINHWQPFFFGDESLSSIALFDREFVKVEWELLMEILDAANYLDIKSLLDLTCQAAAEIIKDKSVGQVRTLFNIYNDFTPEEEKKIREEQPWVFQ